MDIATYALLNGKIKDYASNVDEWLEENVDPATGYVLDRSLQMENAAAPADMVGDINVEVGDLKNTLSDKADMIYDAASGDIASFPDGADGLPVKDLTVAIEPVQDLHGYANPWPAGGGKNLFPFDIASIKIRNDDGTWNGNIYTHNGISWEIFDDGKIKVSGTSSGTSSLDLKINGSNSFVLPAGTYTLSTPGWIGVRFQMYEANYTNGFNITSGSSNTQTLETQRQYTMMYFDVPSGRTIDGTIYIQLELGSTATAYAPYSNICPISGWTGANVSRTGKNLWSIGDISTESESEIAFNLKAGVYTLRGVSNGTQDKAISLRFNHSDSTSTLFTFSNYAGTTLTLSKDVVSLNWYIHSFTSGYKVERIQLEPGSTASAYEAYQGATLPISWQSSAGTVYAASLDALAGSLKVRPYYASYNGETLVGPWISSMDAYTPGGTPTTGAQVVDFGGSETLYSLDSIALNTLLGQNNIWADCGPSTVEYPADTKLYIQKINAPTDDDMIADAQIASGKYFIVNNNLYLSTTTILAGDPIKPGTNCTLTNLAAALNALNS